MDLNTSWWCGFVVETPATTVYFAGDSGYFDQFKEIGRRFSDIELAMLPIGAYDPQWFMSPQHMNPEEALAAMLDVGAKRILPIHWGTYKLSDEPLDEPPMRLASSAINNGVGLDRIAPMELARTFEL
jgi:L-ascorbate metabolism protein UlaG (beta-lactamase superfamily)